MSLATNSVFLICLAFCFLLSVGVGDESEARRSYTDLSEVVQTIKNRTKEFENPEDVPQIKEWMEQCKKKVGGRAFRTIKGIPSRVVSCFSKFVNFKKLQVEVNESMSKGELDLVFKKYCGYRNRIMGCIEDVFEIVKPCLIGREFDTMNFTLDSIDAGFNFTCFENGDRIALFMAEEGVQCLTNSSDSIKHCAYEKVPELKQAEQDLESVKTDVDLFSDKNCAKLWDIQQCIVTHTSFCNDPTPANILESLIMQIIRATPCSRSPSYAPTASSSFYLHCWNYFPQILTIILSGLTAVHFVL